MACLISLFDLANLSIGTPEIGAVNFNALHTLLHAILKNLNIQNVKAEIRDEDRDFFKPPPSLYLQKSPPEEERDLKEKPSPYFQMERKLLEIERQMDALNNLPSSAELLNKSSGADQGSPVGDMWKLMQMRRKVEANEEGISKAMNLLQDLLNEINTLKKSRESMEGEIQKLNNRLALLDKELLARLAALEKHKDHLETLEKLLEKMGLYPSPEDLDNMVTWDILQEALLHGKKNNLGASQGQQPSGYDQTHQPGTQTVQPSQPVQSGQPYDAQSGQPNQPGTQPGQPYQPGTQPGEPYQSGTQPGEPYQSGTQPSQSYQPGAQPGQSLQPGIQADQQYQPGTQPSQQHQPGIQQGLQYQPGTQPGPPHQPSTESGKPYYPATQLGQPHQPGTQQGQAYQTGIQPGQIHQPGTPVGQTYPPGTQPGNISQPGTQPGQRYHPGPQMDHAYQPSSQVVQASTHTGQPHQPSTVEGQQPSSVIPSSSSPNTIWPTSPQVTKPMSAGSSVVSRPTSSRSSSTPERYADTIDALREIGQLTDQHKALTERVVKLEVTMPTKADIADLNKLKDLISNIANTNLPDDLPAQLAYIKELMDELKGDRDKISGAAVQTEGDGQINSQIAYLRSTVHDIEKELKELRERQEKGKAMLESSVAQTGVHLQDQLDKLRSILENMMSSSSALLSMSMQPQQQQQPSPPPNTCPACSIDVSNNVSQLFTRYEELQDLVNGILARQAEMKTKGMQSKDEKLLEHIQNALLLLQGECEKLNSTTGHLIEDHQKKQKDIHHLYQSVEQLDERKADKEHIEMEIDVKADKRALESKVSRTQFDAATDQLNRMMQEMVNKITGQEEDWHKVLEKISKEMDCKLDRIELDPWKKQLEERWKGIRKQLQERPPLYEADDAAGIRKQLVARFHCISCDRPVDMMVPGPHIVTVPNVPGFTTQRSIRPYTVYELEHVRQHARSLKPGRSQTNYQAAMLEKNISHLRRIHSMMRNQIERVQMHFGGSVKANSQMIRELIHTRCPLSTSSFRRGMEMIHRTDNIPELANYSYLASARSCGGSHTLTYPHRRYTRLQHIAQYLQQEEEITTPVLIKQEEIDILGLDGHIYKGRVNSRLPLIPGKDVAPVRSRGKLSNSSSGKPSSPEVENPPARPQSAKISSRSRPVSARTRKERPVSSQGRLILSHSHAGQHPPEAAKPEVEPQGQETLEIRMDIGLSQLQDERPTTSN